MGRIGDFVIVQEKSKIKAGDGLASGKYKFFTSSNFQTKWSNEAQYNQAALIFGTGGMPSVHYCTTPFSTSTDCIVMYAKENANIEIIYHYLVANMNLLEAGFRGVGLQHISKQFILNIEIPHHPEETQRKIVSTCNCIDSLISLRKQQLAKLDELVKSQFIVLFGDIENNDKNWPSYRLADKAEIGSSTRIFAREYVSFGIPFYRSKEIVELGRGEQPSVELFISEDRYQEIKEKYGVPQKGDILMTAVGTIGKFWTVNSDAPFYYKDGNLMYIRASSFDEVFFRFSLEMLIEQYKAKTVNVSAYAALPIEKMKEMHIVEPPLDLQTQFAAFVQQSNKSKLAIQQSLDKLETLKKSLMQQYFG